MIFRKRKQKPRKDSQKAAAETVSALGLTMWFVHSIFFPTIVVTVSQTAGTVVHGVV
jgi:hypothetical protein